MSKRVLVIEDDPDIGRLLEQTLAGAELASTIATSGADGAAAAERERPDVILLDLDLPDADGLDLVGGLSDIAPVIVLTGRVSDESIVTGLERGAEDYVTKPFSPRVLIARVEVALRRVPADQPRRIEHGALVIDLDERQASIDGRRLDLTRRELDLLAHLAAHPGHVLTRDELLTAVWHSSAEWQTPATVTEHVRRIRLKLDDPASIESVRGVGYRFVKRA